MYKVLTDVDVTRLVTMDEIVAAMEDALRARAAGSLVAPPRFSVATERGGLVFTAGAETAGAQAIGFRVYDTFASASPERTQLVAVFDSETGGFRGVVIGTLLGALRTAAINAVAIKHMARADARVIGVIGSGFQARNQLRAAAAVRRPDEVKVYSSTAGHREAFAAEMSALLDLPVRAVPGAEEVVRSADVLICATTSASPVFDASWLKPGTHANTIGPKLEEAHEMPVEAATRSRVIATDSIGQVEAYPQPFFLANRPERERMIELSEIVAGRQAGRTSDDDVTLFCSVGLAGTEVVLANAVLKAARLE